MQPSSFGFKFVKSDSRECVRADHDLIRRVERGAPQARWYNCASGETGHWQRLDRRGACVDPFVGHF